NRTKCPALLSCLRCARVLAAEASRALLSRHQDSGNQMVQNRPGPARGRNNMAGEQKAFPLPSSVKVVPGTEAAQAAYPYYIQFRPEDDERFLFYNSMHFPEPMHHFDMITAEAAYCALGSFNTRVHVLPTTKGIDHRIVNGRVFIGG